MDNKQIEKLLRNMGYTYNSLISNEIIENKELQKLYDTDETLEIQLTQGVELVFWAETMQLEMIEFRFDEDLDKNVFRAALPYPLNIITDQASTHAELGTPLYSLSQFELLSTNLYGLDTYQLDENLHPEALLEIQYGKNMNISCIMISLMDKNV